MKKVWLIFAQATTITLAGLFVIQTLKPQWLSPKPPPAPPRIVEHREPGPLQLPVMSSPASRPGYADAAQAAMPAVVSITASKAARRSNANEEADGDEDLWWRFHGGRKPRNERRPQTGLGSGVIMSSDGYLLTNHHVIEGATDIQVRLADGRETRATLVGTDPETDLAVLRVDLPSLPAIALGDARQLRVGDAVLAIGNPFNVGMTVTSGIVSAIGRNQLGINTFENFIQTDAAINPGNSGGALVDAEGRLLGINTAIYSRSGGSMGIGFAIPINGALQVLQAIVQDGHVSRGWIGVQTREITPEVVEAFKLSETSGVLISGLVQKGPAAKAGVKAGDVMLAIGGKSVNSPVELLSAVAALAPESTASLSLLRGKQRLELSIQVGLRPQPTAAPE